MQEFRGSEENKPHSYEVSKIELLEGPRTAKESDSPHLDSATNNSISTAKLLEGVEKSYDKGKKLLDESRDLTDGETSFRVDNKNSQSSTPVTDTVANIGKVVERTSKKLGVKNVKCLKGVFPEEFDTRPVDVKEKEKAEKAAAEAQHREIVLRDEVVDTLKNNGMDVSMNTEKGQRVLDEANENVRMSAKKRRALETASLGTSPRSLTVVSSATGAKVLKNVETFATELDKSSTQPKTFIDLLVLLGKREW